MAKEYGNVHDKVMDAIGSNGIDLMKDFIANNYFEKKFYDETGIEIEDIPDFSNSEIQKISDALEKGLEQPVCTIELSNGQSYDYSIINEFEINGRLVCLGICDSAEEKYLVCNSLVHYTPFGKFRSFSDAGVSSSYIESLTQFSKRINDLYIDYSKQFECVGKNGDPILQKFEDIAYDSIIYGKNDEDYTDCLVIRRADSLNSGYQSAEFQILVATSGFGCRRDGKVYATELYSGDDVVIRRENIAGKVDMTNLPKELDWVKNKYKEYKKNRTRNSEKKENKRSV